MTTLRPLGPSSPSPRLPEDYAAGDRLRDSSPAQLACITLVSSNIEIVDAELPITKTTSETATPGSYGLFLRCTGNDTQDVLLFMMRKSSPSLDLGAGVIAEQNASPGCTERKTLLRIVLPAPMR